MIDKNAIKIICDEYVIGEYISISKVELGKMNDNYVLETTKGKYFVKSIRDAAKDKVESIYSVELLMKSSGIPAIVMLPTKNNNTSIFLDGSVYTLYPYIENFRGIANTGEEFFEYGEMLGKIHLAGDVDISNYSGIKIFSRPSDEFIFNKLKKYKESIGSKTELDKIDYLFLKYIDLKLSSISKIKQVNLKNDTIIHGDYHPGNILRNESNKIIGIIDWEKTEYAPKTYELARGFLYTCYDKYNNLSLEDKEKFGESFLRGYLKIFSVSTDEIMKGFMSRVHRMVLSSWIEDSYYIRQDTRSLDLIEHEMDLIDMALNKNFVHKIENILKNIIKNP